jgi:hypothetical protein
MTWVFPRNYMIKYTQHTTKKLMLDRIKQLEATIRKTLRKNRHLADGENCTLIDLKNILKDGR